MRIYTTIALYPDASEEICKQAIVAEDKEDAIDMLQDILEREQTEYGGFRISCIDE